MGMELAGFGTIMGATSLMRSIGSGIGAAAGALAHASADAKSDKINADMTDDLADVQKSKIWKISTKVRHFRVKWKIS